MIPDHFSCRIYGVLRRAREVLMTRSIFPSLSAKGDTLPAPREFVNFPGGGVELGESPIEALAREYQEETGLGIKPARVLYASEGLHVSTYRPLQIVAIYWLVEEVSGEIKRGGNGDDIKDLFWADIDRIPTEEMFPSDLEFALKLPALLRETGVAAKR